MSKRVIKMVVRMPEELHQQLRQQASERHQSMNTVAVLGIAREVDTEQSEIALLRAQVASLNIKLSRFLDPETPV